MMLASAKELLREKIQDESALPQEYHLGRVAAFVTALELLEELELEHAIPQEDTQ